MQTSVSEIINNMEGRQALLQILLAVQDASPENYVSEDAVNDIAYMLNVSRSRVYSTASFYSVISLKPRGRHIVRVCINAPCENAGKKEIVEVLEDQLGIRLGETTADKQFTLEGVSCLGACYVSPAIKIDDTLYGDLTPELVVAILREYQEEATVLDCTAS